MEEHKLVDIEEVKDVLGDTINSEGDYHHALRLLNGLSSVTEQDIVKPVLDKIKEEIKTLSPTLTEYDIEYENPVKNAIWEILADVLYIIDEYREENEEQ